MPRPPLTRLNARRIALLKLSALGDVVHALPVLGALRHRFPNAKLSWIVNRGYTPLLDGNPDLDEIIPFDRGWLRQGLWRGILVAEQFARTLRQHRFDLVIDLQGLFRSAMLVVATGSPRRVGFAHAREGAPLVYTDRLPGRIAEMHAVDRYWRVAQALGVGDLPKRFPVAVQPDASAWAMDRLRGLPRPWLVVCPGSRWATKCWPPEHFAELLRRAGGSALILGSPDEAPVCAAVAQRLTGSSLNLSGHTDIARLVAVLALGDVVLANDSGPLHVAAALGRPVIAPYTCTEVRLHGPYGHSDHAVETSVACRGSYLRKCSKMICMDELTPDRLWPVLDEVLTRWQRDRRSA